MVYRVPFVDPGKNYRMIQSEMDEAYRDVMTHGDLILRRHLRDFEEHLAEFVGTKYAVGLNSGYHALLISLLAAGIGPGDEVIVPSHTCLATASAVVNAGALPVLVDVASDYNIDPENIEEAISPSTRAIMPVHLNGRVCEMDVIMRLAEERGLVVIEDACQSLGGRFEGRAAGTFGVTGCWSFYPFKILGGYGDNGAITTDDAEVARFAKRYRYNGEDRETGQYHCHGVTCLMDNLQAAFLDAKLKHLLEWIDRRRAVAAMYRDGLSGVGDLALPHFEDARFEDVFQNYVVRTEKRDELVEHLEGEGVEVLVHWPIPYYRHRLPGLIDRGFQETEAISREVVSLPMNVELDDEQVEYVIASVRSLYEVGDSRNAESLRRARCHPPCAGLPGRPSS